MEEPGTVICNRAKDGERSGRLSVVRGKPKLLNQLHQALRSRHYSPRTDQTYCHCVKRFIYFHNVSQPGEMEEPEINAFLTHRAVACPSVTPLPHTCSKAAMTSAPYRNCSATKTCEPV
jgi:hypothetical protein